MPRGWLSLLCLYLFVWEPLRFAGDVSRSMGTFAMRGLPGGLELAGHGAIAAMAVAAAWGLWSRNPGAPMLASIAVAGSALASVQSLNWSYLPGNTVPGESLPLSVVAIAHAAGWMTYLRKSRRVRIVYG
jgi:hypothetical protein